MKIVRYLAQGVCVLSLLAMPIAASAQELIVNGSFEEPALGGNTWTVFANIPGWTGTNCGIEIQSHSNAGAPDTGVQLVELDSHCSSGIYQDVPTVAGFTYSLSFAFSPRAGVVDNHLVVQWDGATVASLTASGVGNANTVWQYSSYNVSATSPTTRLQFDDASVSNSLGTYLDSVSLTVDPYASVNSMCPCDASWTNHGEYMTCVVSATKTLKDASYITAAQSGSLRSAAAQLSCGK